LTRPDLPPWRPPRSGPSRPSRSPERSGAHGRHDFRIGRLDGLDRVAGVDRPLEGLHAHDLDDVGDLHHVEERRDPRHDVLGVRCRRRDDRVIGRRELDDQRRERLSERMRVSRVVRQQHLADAGKLGRRLRRASHALTGDERVDRLADLERRGQRARSCRPAPAPRTSAAAR
jgi:hypothetical protein